MTFGEALISFLGAVIGGGGVTSLCVWLFRLYLEKRLSAAESKAAERRRTAKRREEIDDRLHHAYGRMFFWMNRALTAGESNAELEKAFEELQLAEAARKELIREVAAGAITDE